MHANRHFLHKRDLNRIARVGICALVFLAGVSVGFAQSPPPQPTSGPGAQGIYTTLQNTYGTGGRQYWIFTPQPQPSGPLPVVVFNHGWGAVNPAFYQAWIDHIVSRGNIVIYPRYQETIAESFTLYTTNAIEALKSAFATLGPSADVNRVAFVGHSVGAILNFNIAARAASSGLPIPKAILSAHPAVVDLAVSLVEVANYPNIPASTPILVLVGDQDTYGDVTARLMISAIPHVSAKNFITVQSDTYGSPPLIADHFAPNAPLVNALDYYVYWKLADALYDFVFYGTEGEYAIGGGDLQTSAGFWSDGVPIKPLLLRPTLSPIGVLNAATLRPGPVAPGQLVTIVGAGLGPKILQGIQVDGENKVSTTNSGTRVLFQGIPSPVVSTFMNQIAAVVPSGVSSGGNISMQVLAGGFTSESIIIGTVPTNPGIFSANGSGIGQGAILNANFSANSSLNPALKGSSVMIFATGAGATNPATVDGVLTTGELTRPIQPVSLTIGGLQAEISYAGAAPGFVGGTLQITAKIPLGVPAGTVPVVLTVGGASSQSGITVAVK